MDYIVVLFIIVTIPIQLLVMKLTATNQANKSGKIRSRADIKHRSKYGATNHMVAKQGD